MARTGAEPLGSMGTDTPIAVLSSRPRLLFDYFTQLFAQVTNPPLDAIREELVTSLGGTIGPEGNLLGPRCRRPAARSTCRGPIIDNDELAKLTQIDTYDGMEDFRAAILPCLFPVADGRRRAARTRSTSCASRPAQAIEDGANILILSDRNSTAETWRRSRRCWPSSAVHHHLIREKTRTRVGLVVESGDAREVHHMALLIGYGAAAINPYLAFETIEDLIAEGLTEVTDPVKAVRNYIKACGKGVLKVMSKMGISTVASYTGAQIFEAIGLAQELVDEFFTGTVSRLGGVGLDELAREVAERHALAYPDRPEERAHRQLDGGRRVPVAPRGRVPPVQPRDRLQAPARHPHPSATRSSRSTPHAVDDQSRAPGHPARPVPLPRRASVPRCRSTRSSRSARSSSASPPGPCPTARSRPRPTRRWPSP